MRYASLLMVFAVHGVIGFCFLNHKEELPASADDVSFFTVLLLPQHKKETVSSVMDAYQGIEASRSLSHKAFIPFNEKLFIDDAGKSADVVDAERKAAAIAVEIPAPTPIFNRDKIDLASIDKVLRAGKPGVPKERPDTPQRRLERGIADAFVGYSESVTDHYTSPDGVVYSRTTKNGRSSCFMSGGSNVIPGIMHNGSGASGAKSVNCPPPDSGWEK